MGLLSPIKRDCYCAFCKIPRRVFVQKHLGMFNYLQALCLALASSFIFWGQLDPKALVIFFMALLFIEGLILIIRRLSIPCPHCGFDAFLYSRNQNAAAEKVKFHLEARREDPRVWLGQKPPLRFAKKRKLGKSTKEIVV